MLTEFLWPELDVTDVKDMFFQQDAAGCHAAHETMELLPSKLSGRVISRYGDQNCPPRSCGLTPIDFFLWGYMKEKMYANWPKTVEDLKEEIRRVISEPHAHLCESVIQNFNKSITLCERFHGGHLPDAVFHV